MRLRFNTPKAAAFGVLRVLALLALLPLGLSACGSGENARDSDGAAASADTQTLDAQALPAQLRIDTAAGARLFQVELALTPATQQRGLMFRRELAPDHGMLFVFGKSRTIGMWMKNTYIPLDMLFVRRDGVIARIAENTEPFSEAVISSGVPVYAVFEVVGGTAARLGIKPGDRLDYPLFASGG